MQLIVKEKVINHIQNNYGSDTITTDKRPVHVTKDEARQQIGDEALDKVLQGTEIVIGDYLYKLGSFL